MCADDVNLFGDNTNTTKQITETLIDPSKVAYLEVNTGKTGSVLMSRHQNSGENRNLKIASRSFENLVKFE
jgi:hypothetical protein